MISAKSSSSPELRWFLIAVSRFVRNSWVSWAFSSFTMTYLCCVLAEKPITSDKRTMFIDSEISLHDIPMLMAVSWRSPVRTQTYNNVSNYFEMNGKATLIPAI